MSFPTTSAKTDYQEEPVSSEIDKLKEDIAKQQVS